MRFSLTTLLLLSLLSGSLMAVWFRREAWYQVREYTSTKKWEEREGESRSPDNSRILIARSIQQTHQWILLVCEKGDSRPLFVFEDHVVGRPYAARFISDDEIHASTEKYSDFDGEPRLIDVYRRRFPEWWWGHLYRPEVWASLLLSLTLAVRFVRARRRSKLSDSTHPAISSIPS